jgi:hypothetical protein
VNIHARGQSLLNRGTNDAAGTGVSVTYTRSATSATIVATAARLTPDATTPPVPGAKVDDRERDYFIVYADLVAAGFNEPQSGDRITETINGTAVIFEMHRPQSQPGWSWADAQRTRVVIHTRKKG